MARFLFAMWEGGGTVPPELAVAPRLIARGHVVHVLGDPTIAASAERAHTFDQATGSDVILLLTAEAFDFPGPPLPSNVKYVGPQLDDPLWADPWEWPWGADDVRPLVLVGFSTTYQAQSGTLARVVHALGRRRYARSSRPVPHSMLRLSARLRTTWSSCRRRLTRRS